MRRPLDARRAALHWNKRLARAADAYAHTMARNSWFDHVSPNGATLTSRVRSAGYRGYAGGENIASGQPTAASVVAAWVASPGHCENLMRRSFDEVGVGFARHRVAGYSSPVTYWVQDFGSK